MVKVTNFLHFPLYICICTVIWQTSVSTDTSVKTWNFLSCLKCYCVSNAMLLLVCRSSSPLYPATCHATDAEVLPQVMIGGNNCGAAAVCDVTHCSHFYYRLSAAIPPWMLYRLHTATSLYIDDVAPVYKTVLGKLWVKHAALWLLFSRDIVVTWGYARSYLRLHAEKLLTAWNSKIIISYIVTALLMFRYDWYLRYYL